MLERVGMSFSKKPMIISQLYRIYIRGWLSQVELTQYTEGPIAALNQEKEPAQSPTECEIQKYFRVWCDYALLSCPESNIPFCPEVVLVLHAGTANFGDPTSALRTSFRIMTADLRFGSIRKLI